MTSVVPDGVAINKTETANKIVFISFYSNVYTDQFLVPVGHSLFDRERFTITRQTRNERRIEQTIE